MELKTLAPPPGPAATGAINKVKVTASNNGNNNNKVHEEGTKETLKKDQVSVL